MKLRRLVGITLVVGAIGVAPALAQKGGGGGPEGGGGGNSGGGSAGGAAGGGSSPGGSIGGGGGGGGSTFGGGGGGGSSMGSFGSGPDWSSSSRGGNRRIDGERFGGRGPEPSYARSVSPAGSGGADPARTAGRSRGDRPAIGVAVERTTPIDRGNRGGGGFERFDPYYGGGYYGYSSFGACTWPYPLYSRCYDPYYSGFGYYGLGSLFYDPYWSYGQSGIAGPPVPMSEGLGALRIKVKPNKGQVFIDGYYVGTVDEFDGATQKIKLEQGHHRVEVRLLGYEPLVFDIDVRRGQTSVFEGQLRPRQ